jgi:hypothetical protein
MSNGANVASARCVHCREEVQVPARYAHGDHLKCGVCGTDHRVVRGDRLRLVLADVGPLRDALAQNEQLVRRLEADLSQAHGSFGIGANGIVLGIAFAVYQVAWKGAALDASLLGNAIGIAIVTGILLELANWTFLAKRQRITRLSAELQEAQAEGTRLRQLIRDSKHV